MASKTQLRKDQDLSDDDVEQVLILCALCLFVLGDVACIVTVGTGSLFPPQPDARVQDQV